MTLTPPFLMLRDLPPGSSLHAGMVFGPDGLLYVNTIGDLFDPNDLGVRQLLGGGGMGAQGSEMTRGQALG